MNEMHFNIKLEDLKTLVERKPDDKVIMLCAAYSDHAHLLIRELSRKYNLGDIRNKFKIVVYPEDSYAMRVKAYVAVLDYRFNKNGRMSEILDLLYKQQIQVHQLRDGR